MEQLGLFDVLRKPPVVIPVDRDGQVVQGDVDEHLFLAHPRYAWNRADIELHCHESGLWMWATGWCDGSGGGGYRVGAKWGKFAETRDDALFYAVRELTDRLASRGSPDAALIVAWARGLA